MLQPPARRYCISRLLRLLWLVAVQDLVEGLNASKTDTYVALTLQNNTLFMALCDVDLGLRI